MVDSLRLARFSGEDDVIAFDRRHRARLRMSGEALAVFIGPDGLRRVGPVSLRDLASDGLGLRSRVPVPEGSTCTVYNEAPGPRRLHGPGSPVFVGRVVRTVSADGGFDVGVSLARSNAA
ncbi:MAG: hypothetical protein AAF138_05900 [Planctomycetota bacterium]